MKTSHTPLQQSARRVWNHSGSILGITAATIFIGLAATASAQTTYQWAGNGTTDWATPANWAAPGLAASNGTFNARLNVNGPVELIYSAAQGNTTYASSGGTGGGRGLVVGSGALGNGTFTISGGTFSTNGSTTADIVGNVDGNVGILNISGGNFIGTAAGTSLGIGTGPGRVSTLNVNSGNATVSTLSLNSSNATVNLNGGNLYVNSFATVVGSTSNINFNGGTLLARASTATFLQGLTNVRVLSGGAVVNSNGFDITIAQALLNGGGGGGLTKTGAGNLTLSSSAGNYTGTTAVTGGSLVIGSSANINSSSGVSISNGGRFVYSNTSTALTPAISLNNGTLTGVGAVTLGDITVGSDVNSLILNNNGAAGATLTTGSINFLGDATLSLWNAASGTAALAAGALTTNAGGMVTVNASTLLGTWQSGTTYSLVSYTGGSIGGAGFGQFQLGTVAGLGGRQTANLVDSGSAISLSITGAVVLWTGNESGDWNTTATNWELPDTTPTQFIAGDDVLFNDSGNNFFIDINAANISAGKILFDNSSVDYFISSSGSFGISTAVSLTKNGTGSVTLSTANSFIGTTTVNDGNLILGDAAALSGSTLDTSGNGNILFGVSGNVTYFLGGLQGSKDLDIGSNSLNIGANGFSTTYGGNLTMQGSLTKNGTGSLTLSGSNSYTGATVINGGTLRLGSASAMPSTTAVTIANVAGATLDINSFNQTIASLAGGGATGGTVALGTGNLTITAATNQTYNGVFTGSGDLIINAASPTATVSFGGTGTGQSTSFTGNVRVQSGTFILGKTADILGTNSAGLGSQSIFVSNNATARLAYGNAAYNQRQNFVLNGTGADGNGALQALAMNFGNAAIGGIVAETDSLVRVTRDASDTATRTLLVSNSLAGSGNLTFNGGGGSKPGFVQFNVASGNLTLGGTTYETYSGNLALTGNVTLISNAANALGNVQLVTVNSGSTATFNSAATQTIGGLAGAGTVNINGITLTAGAGNLTSSFSGVMQNTSGNGSLTKIGSGILTLGGNNTYTGVTTIFAGTILVQADGRIHGSSSILVNAGRLIVNGSTGLGSVTVASGAILGGNGTIGGNVAMNGNLNPGNSPGLLTFEGDLTLGGTAITTMQLAAAGGVKGTDFDNISVNSIFTYGGDLLIASFGGFSLDTIGTYDLFDAGSFAGNFATVTVGTASLTFDSGVWTGDNGVSNYTYTNSTGVLEITAIPEPGTALLLGLGLAGIALLRSRKRA